MGPLGGASKVGAKAAKLAKWLEIKDGPDLAVEEEEEDEPLPFEGELEFLGTAQTPRARQGSDGSAATNEGMAAVGPGFDVEGMNIDQLNALLAVASAEKARLADGGAPVTASD